MSTQTIKTTFKLRRGFSFEWQKKNPILAEGEPGWTLDTHILKIGDGTTPWESLPSVSIDAQTLEALLAEEIGIERSEGEQSVAQITDAQNKNFTYSPFGAAFGMSNISGVKGFYMLSVDVDNMLITVNDAELQEKASAVYAVGDMLNFDASRHYYNLLTIVSLTTNSQNQSVIGVKYDGVAELNLTLDKESAENYCWVVGKNYGKDIPLTKATFAEGELTQACGRDSHAEGRDTQAIGNYAHVEGRSTKAGYCAHAEGLFTQALGHNAHSEGDSTVALGTNGHAENYDTKALGPNSHAEGLGTRALGSEQHVQGRYNNYTNYDKYAHIVGGGSSNNDRKNIYTLDWNGNAEYAGNISIESSPSTGKHLTTKKYVDDAMRSKAPAGYIDEYLQSTININTLDNVLVSALNKIDVGQQYKLITSIEENPIMGQGEWLFELTRYSEEAQIRGCSGNKVAYRSGPWALSPFIKESILSTVDFESDTKMEAVGSYPIGELSANSYEGYFSWTLGPQAQSKYSKSSTLPAGSYKLTGYAYLYDIAPESITITVWAYQNSINHTNTLSVSLKDAIIKETDKNGWYYFEVNFDHSSNYSIMQFILKNHASTEGAVVLFDEIKYIQLIEEWVMPNDLSKFSNWILLGDGSLDGHAQQKHDLEVNWISSNYVPLNGEIIIYDAEIQGDDTHLPVDPLDGSTLRNHWITTPRVKIGDGTTPINSLSFTNTGNLAPGDAPCSMVGIVTYKGGIGKDHSPKAYGWHTIATGPYCQAGQIITNEETGEEDWGGNYAIALGYNNKVYGNSSFAANSGHKIYGTKSAAFGTGNQIPDTATNALALGINTHSKGAQTISGGYQSIASGENALAVGYYAEATGKQSVAFGNNTNAFGLNAFTTGAYTTADGENAIAFGDHSIASGGNSLAIGKQVHAYGAQSLSMGFNTTVEKDETENSAAFGSNTYVKGKCSTVMGSSVNVVANNSFAGGVSSTIKPEEGQTEDINGSLAWGVNTTVTGGQSIAFGKDTKAKSSYALAGGLGAEALGPCALAYGYHVKTAATINGQIALGRYNITNKNALFTIGNGTKDMPSNAFMVNIDGSAVLQRGLTVGAEGITIGDKLINKTYLNTLVTEENVNNIVEAAISNLGFAEGSEF